jgi:hypothetical protein
VNHHVLSFQWGRVHTCEAIFFLSAASAFASALASFFAVSFSSAACFSTLNVPIFETRASVTCQLTGDRIGNTSAHTLRIVLQIQIIMVFIKPLLTPRQVRSKFAVFWREGAHWMEIQGKQSIIAMISVRMGLKNLRSRVL